MLSPVLAVDAFSAPDFPRSKAETVQEGGRFTNADATILLDSGPRNPGSDPQNRSSFAKSANVAERTVYVPKDGTKSIASLESNAGSVILRPFIWIERNLPIIALAATIIAALRLIAIMIAASFQKDRERRRARFKWWPKKVTILIPAYNAAEIVCETIQSLLQSGRSNFDILVIDDGSFDSTAQVVRKTFADEKRVRVHRIGYAGRASALNYGLSQTDAEIVVALEDDAVLAPDAIELLVRHFRDPNIGAVAGSAVIGNQTNLVTRFQALEYVTSQNLEHRAFEVFNCVSAVPGAVGAWRRAALMEAGGYSTDTLAEDSDLTLAIQRIGWKVIYEPRSFALTDAPETLGTFLRQRIRWTFGALQVAWKHFGALVSGNSLTIGWITIPNILIFHFLFRLFAPIMDALLIWFVLSTIINAIPGVTGGELNGLSNVALYWAAFRIMDFFSTGFAINLAEDGEHNRLIPKIMLQRFGYRQLLYLMAIPSLFSAIIDRFLGQGKLLRTDEGGWQGQAAMTALPPPNVYVESSEAREPAAASLPPPPQYWGAPDAPDRRRRAPGRQGQHRSARKAQGADSGAYEMTDRYRHSAHGSRGDHSNSYDMLDRYLHSAQESQGARRNAHEKRNRRPQGAQDSQGARNRAYEKRDQQIDSAQGSRGNRSRAHEVPDHHRRLEESFQTLERIQNVGSPPKRPPK